MQMFDILQTAIISEWNSLLWTNYMGMYKDL